MTSAMIASTIMISSSVMPGWRSAAARGLTSVESSVRGHAGLLDGRVVRFGIT